jgi:sulfite exporter TauE/SafE
MIGFYKGLVIIQGYILMLALSLGKSDLKTAITKKLHKAILLNLGRVLTYLL